MAKIDKSLKVRLQKNPEDMVRLIVRVGGEVPVAAGRLAQRGAKVLRSFELINAVSVSLPGKTALSLLEEPWVKSVEQDRKVSTQ